MFFIKYTTETYKIGIFSFKMLLFFLNNISTAVQSRSSETSTEEHEGKHNAYSVDFKQISSENSVLKKICRDCMRSDFRW